MMKLDISQKSWVLYDMANAAFALIVRTVFAALLFKYCANEVWGEARTTAYWGYICSISGIAAGFFSIFSGFYADSKNCKKTFLILTVAMGTVSTAAFFLIKPGMVWGVSILSFLSLGCYMVANSFYDSLLISVAPPEKRDRLSSFAYACGYIGGVIPFIICLILTQLLPDKIMAMKISFIIAAAWWGLLTLPLVFFVKEQKNTAPHGGFRYLQECLAAILKNKNVLLFLVAYFLYIDGVGTIYTMAAPIANDIGISNSMLLAVILGLQFLAFPCTILYGSLSQKFHPRNLVLFAIGIYVVISCLALALGMDCFKEHRTGIFIALAVLIGTSQGGIQSLSRSLFSRIIPPAQAAEFYGFYNFFGKFTTIVGPVLIGISVALWGKSEIGIAFLSISFILGAILLTRVDFSTHKS